MSRVQCIRLSVWKDSCQPKLPTCPYCRPLNPTRRASVLHPPESDRQADKDSAVSQGRRFRLTPAKVCGRARCAYTHRPMHTLASRSSLIVRRSLVPRNLTDRPIGHPPESDRQADKDSAVSQGRRIRLRRARVCGLARCAYTRRHYTH